MLSGILLAGLRAFLGLNPGLLVWPFCLFLLLPFGASVLFPFLSFWFFPRFVVLSSSSPAGSCLFYPPLPPGGPCGRTASFLCLPSLFVLFLSCSAHSSVFFRSPLLLVPSVWSALLGGRLGYLLFLVSVGFCLFSLFLGLTLALRSCLPCWLLFGELSMQCDFFLFLIFCYVAYRRCYCPSPFSCL